MTVYIMGPITGMPDFNRRAFYFAEAMIRHLGHHPVNPHEVSQYHPDKTWRDYMRECIKALVDCDAVYKLPGWWRSHGALLESVICWGLGIKRVKMEGL